jgi:sortase (surface protein transpeptidase)
LTACHPPFSARYRLAVMADLVEVRRLRSSE